MSFFPYFLCVLLGVDSLRGGLAEGNRIQTTFTTNLTLITGCVRLFGSPLQDSCKTAALEPCVRLGTFRKFYDSCFNAVSGAHSHIPNSKIYPHQTDLASRPTPLYGMHGGCSRQW